MNIMKQYSNCRPSRIDELDEAISAVKRAVLKMTESIPKELLNEHSFNPQTDELICSKDPFDEQLELKDGCLYIWSSFTEFQFGQFEYDDSAAKKLNEILAKYYPSISCCYRYDIDVYNRKIDFRFYYNGRANDFSLYDELRKFCTDFSTIVHRKLKLTDWLFEPARGSQSDFGDIYLEFPIN